uniref:murein L,D-transpeptidase catalytic domain family protein n=1 Tax=Altererythrobacter segetis TaxID=1104773 RepID=UPI00140DF528|nr:murein L,D-transpeptidase catalytic domain family protein [Altererythrobacter segetis]
MILNRRHFVAAAAAMTVSASSALLGRSTPLARRTPSPLLPPQVPAAVRAADEPPLLAEARAALDAHAPYLGRRDKIGLVDFSLASRERRFYLVDLEGGQIEHMWLVAHGKGSDLTNTGYVQRFSNEPGSNASSRGSYVTATPYYGKHGRSQRLIGLDPDNSAALDRAIVIHGASYVDPAMIDARGRIGRSFGCFAVEDCEVNRVMGALGEGRLLYAGKSA